jgi:hypothetical protein
LLSFTWTRLFPQVFFLIILSLDHSSYNNSLSSWKPFSSFLIWVRKIQEWDQSICNHLCLIFIQHICLLIHQLWNQKSILRSITKARLRDHIQPKSPLTFVLHACHLCISLHLTWTHFPFISFSSQYEPKLYQINPGLNTYGSHQLY